MPRRAALGRPTTSESANLDQPFALTFNSSGRFTQARAELLSCKSFIMAEINFARVPQNLRYGWTVAGRSAPGTRHSEMSGRRPRRRVRFTLSFRRSAPRQSRLMRHGKCRLVSGRLSAASGASDPRGLGRRTGLPPSLSEVGSKTYVAVRNSGSPPPQVAAPYPVRVGVWLSGVSG